MSGPPPGPCTSGVAPPGKITRSSSIPLKDIINNPDVEIKDVEAARTLLDQVYMIHGEPAMPEHISQVLFYISQAKGINNTLQSIIHATAFLVRELTVLALANSITRAVADKLDSMVLIAISPHVQSLADDVGTVKSALEEVKNLLRSNAPPAPFPASYRDTLTSATANPNQILLGTCPTSEHARAHVAIKERQILIELNSDHPLLNNTTRRETSVDLIKQAIDTVDHVDGPGLQLKSIAHICNNCILLELNSQESTAWIKDMPSRTTFLEKLGGTAMIKDRQYGIVIPFLPVTTELDNPGTLCEMENENNILTGLILHIKWIKDPTK
ncbi:hypothetical protein M404DRAFT_125328, partial [Pisolithus tinctorius Marx 270]